MLNTAIFKNVDSINSVELSIEIERDSHVICYNIIIPHT